jgi:hypothetical protein
MAKSFQATNKEELQEVYDEIDSLNPSPIRSEQYLDKKALFIYPLILALLLGGWLLLKDEGMI